MNVSLPNGIYQVNVVRPVLPTALWIPITVMTTEIVNLHQLQQSSHASIITGEINAMLNAMTGRNTSVNQPVKTLEQGQASS
jgi:hypothetical protein